MSDEDLIGDLRELANGALTGSFAMLVNTAANRIEALEHAELDAKRHREKYEGLRGLQNDELTRFRAVNAKLLAVVERIPGPRNWSVPKGLPPYWFCDSCFTSSSKSKEAIEHPEQCLWLAAQTALADAAQITSDHTATESEGARDD